MRSKILVFALLFFYAIPVSGQNLFNRLREQVNPQGQHHNSGYRGGISLYNSPYPESQTIYRGSLDVNGVCGFDFSFNQVEQIVSFLESAPEQLEALLPGILYVLLCQFYPSACDAFKHIQGYVNQTLRFLKADCQKIMQLGHLAGIANRSEAEAACVRDVLGETGNVETAINTCSVGLAELRGPNGSVGANINLMETLFESVQVEPEIRELMVDALPNFVLRSSGNLFQEEASAQPDTAIKKHAEETDEFRLEILEKLAELAASGEISGGLAYIGGTIPNDALYAMLGMDGARQEQEVNHMASNMALAKTLFDYLQAASHLATAMQVSSISDSQRKMLERSYDGVIKETERLKMQKEIPDMSMQKQVNSLLKHNAEAQAWAAQSIRRDYTRGKTTVAIPETGQDLFGIPR